MMNVPTMRLASIALAFTLAGPAAADQLTVGQLLEFCASSNGSAAYVACAYYIVGVVDGTRNADGVVMNG